MTLILQSSSSLILHNDLPITTNANCLGTYTCCICAKLKEILLAASRVSKWSPWIVRLYHAKDSNSVIQHSGKKWAVPSLETFNQWNLKSNCSLSHNNTSWNLSIHLTLSFSPLLKASRERTMRWMSLSTCMSHYVTMIRQERVRLLN